MSSVNLPLSLPTSHHRGTPVHHDLLLQAGLLEAPGPAEVVEHLVPHLLLLLAPLRLLSVGLTQ